MISRPSSRLRFVLGLGLLLSLLLLPAATFAGAPASTAAQAAGPQPGSYYIVQRGDTWSNVSAKSGVAIAALKAANPSVRHPNDWLWRGDRLYIPGKAAAKATATATVAGSTATGGYWYTVKNGDTWKTVSRQTGLAVLVLMHANPGLLHSNGWIYVGERIWVPGKAPAASTTATPATAVPYVAATVVVVTPTIDLTPRVHLTPTLTITPTLEMTATIIVTPTETMTPTATAMPTDTSTPTATPVPTATDTPTATAATAESATSTPLPSATSVPTDTAVPLTATTTLTATSAPTATAVPTSAASATTNAAPACPADFAAYPDTIAVLLNTPGQTPDDLTAWLTACGVVKDKLGGVTPAAIQNATSADLMVVIHEPAADVVTPKGMLLVYFAGSQGYALAGEADGAGRIALLRAGDVNKDGKPDIIFTDTTCGAHTCFSTLFVNSWDGKTFLDYIEGEPTMADAQYSFVVSPTLGTGESIVAHGGVIGSAGAGPQRAGTETYASPQGAPYHLASTTYDTSECLYHRIIDANKLFDDWAKSGFAPAIKAYQAAIDDTTLTTCGTIKDELAVLRDFARFRLMLATIGNGKPAAAAKIVPDIKTPAIAGAAKTFIDSDQANGSIVQACRDTTDYAIAHPESWNYLADWGYANPTFKAEDLCPLD
jgi:LysM repeat protein